MFGDGARLYTGELIPATARLLAAGGVCASLGENVDGECGRGERCGECDGESGELGISLLGEDGLTLALLGLAEGVGGWGCSQLTWAWLHKSMPSVGGGAAALRIDVRDGGAVIGRPRWLEAGGESC
jgi:hypothetical protein